MDSLHEAMKKIIERCDICLEGNIISREQILKAYTAFILMTIDKNRHNVGFILHTGSLCFDAVLLSFAAITDILYNQTDAEDIVSSLEPGDFVLYYSAGKANESEKPARWIFSGFADSETGSISGGEIKKYVVLKNGSETYKLPRSRWSRIVPYSGTSTRTDGRGLRSVHNKRKQFFKLILELSDEEIPRTIDRSTVAVMRRDRADFLINNLSFRFGSNDIALKELVPASYFTDTDKEYFYGGNQAKVESVIKITSRISVARKLLLNRNGNKNVGLLVFGDDSVRRGESELHELIERQSLQYVYLCAAIDSDLTRKMADKYEEAHVFACTKEFLLENSLPVKEKNKYTNLLEHQIDAIIDTETYAVNVAGFIDKSKYRAFRQALFALKSSDYNSDEKDDFIIQAYSLMNLFATSVFSVAVLNRLIDSGEIDQVDKPEARLRLLSELAATFPETIRESSDIVIDSLEEAFLLLLDGSPKEIALKQILDDNKDCRIAIIVPKAYYIPAVKAAFENRPNLFVNTSNRFDSSELYNLIISVGDASGSRFDPFKCKASNRIAVLLYDAEKYRFRARQRQAKAEEYSLNRRSTIAVDEVYEPDEYITEDIWESDEAETQDKELTQYVDTVALKAVHTEWLSDNDKRTMADTVAVARFDNDDIIFFTKNYKAYVLDEDDNSAKEVSVNELAEGDTVIFTRSNSKTRDIVEDLLKEMVQNGILTSVESDAYYKASEWKQTLVNYLKDSGRSVKSIADEMIGNGVTVQEITIRGWLDEESHTIRPRELDNIRQIALIAGNEALFDDAEECFAAGSIVYRVRRKILDAIGKAILNEAIGKENDDAITAAVSDRIKAAAVILTIENILFRKDHVPVNNINRPLSTEKQGG